MKINGLKKKALWENIKCCCIKGDVEHSYPLSECKHCKYNECWLSVPQDDFKVKESEMKNDKPTGKIITRTIKEITLVRGSHEDIIGWNF